MSNDRLPPELDSSNLANDWPNWKRGFMVYLIASGKAAEAEPKKIANFLWLIGTDGANIYNTLFPNDGTENSLLGTEIVGDVVLQRSLNDVLVKFDQHCLPQKNVAMESYKFNMIEQKERQSFAEFETELRTQIRRCEFKCECGQRYEERMLRDRIIIGVHDKKLQLKLLDGRDEDVNQVIGICKTYEAANVNKSILDAKVSALHAVSMGQQHEAKTAALVGNRFCFNCGGPWHVGHVSECKAKDVTCHSCLKKGHFQRMCRKPRNKTAGQKHATNGGHKQKVAGVNWSEMEGKTCNQVSVLSSILSSKHICRLNSIIPVGKRWTKKYLIGDEVVTFKLDTGADVNCIPLKLVDKLGVEVDTNENNFLIFDYNNNKIQHFGTCRINCIDLVSNMSNLVDFVVVGGNCEPIIGLGTCERFQLIRRLDVMSVTGLESQESFMEKYGDVFQGLGKFPGRFRIVLREGSVPVLHYRKRIPNALLGKLEMELGRMVRDEIISPVNYPTDWVNNLQLVEKANGELRICLDPKALNRCIKRQHFLIPTIDDLTSKLAGKRIFSVLDLKSGFWHMVLDKKSSDLTTFLTPFGRYRFMRVPFGLSCAPEMFQQEMIRIFGDIQGVFIYFDDMIVCGDDDADHDRIVKLVMDRARANDIKFNPEKIQYRRREVRFMGNVLSDCGVRADFKYTKAILEMRKPQDRAGVLRFLGLLKYLGRFIPNLSKCSASLRNLTRNDVDFVWTSEHDREFKDLLLRVATEPVLALYDPKLPVIIQTDASKDGLGCVLMQNGRPVVFASRTLSKSEQKWAQIEKELLAIVFACQRFHFFLYGREFKVETDHKPLEALVRRDIDDVTMRLQRMFMFLLKYPYMTVVYRPGREMLLADCLSRAQLSEIAEIQELSGVIHGVIGSVCMSPGNYEYYRKILDSDRIYSRIREYVEKGWPGYRHLNSLGQQFHKLRSGLHVEKGLLFVNHRLVIPVDLQRKIAIWLHSPHLGIEKTLARARKLYYWPGMNRQIKELVASCKVCEKFRRNNQKEPLKQDEIPRYPFHTVAIDLFEYAGRDYVALIDAYSNYLMSSGLRNKTSAQIISAIRRIFDMVGYPTIIRCDNNPFGSGEFARFAEEYNIQFKFSSPRYPQSNGLAEKGVSIAKNIIRRCFEVNDLGQFPYYVLEYNTTPLTDMNITPSELFFGRLVKTKLPICESLLIGRGIDGPEIQAKLRKRKEKQKYYYDRSAKSLPPLNVGDLVMFRKSDKDWHYGRIMSSVNGRSYVIRDNFDNYYRRNRRFVVKTKNEDFNASELLFEENLQDMRPSPNNRKNRVSVYESTGAVGSEDVCLGYESVPPVGVEEPGLSATSEITPGATDSSVTESTTIDPPSAGPKVTRSGRIIRPPVRYRDYEI